MASNRSLQQLEPRVESSYSLTVFQAMKAILQQRVGQVTPDRCTPSSVTRDSSAVHEYSYSQGLTPSLCSFEPYLSIYVLNTSAASLCKSLHRHLCSLAVVQAICSLPAHEQGTTSQHICTLGIASKSHDERSLPLACQLF